MRLHFCLLVFIFYFCYWNHVLSNAIELKEVIFKKLKTTHTPTSSHEERDVEKHPFNKPFRSSADEIISNLQALPLLAETISTSAPSAEAAEIVKNLLSSYYAVGYWMAKYETIMKNS